MDNLRLRGFSLIGICVFKLVMTPVVGVRPDPANVTITLIALALGGLQVFWALVMGKETPSAGNCDRRGVHDSLCRCAANSRM